MEVITRTAELERACEALARSPYVTVDTEFIRETTFWPELCLVQLASDDTTALVDPLADGLSLEPLFALMRDPSVTKVFHAARRDRPGPAFRHSGRGHGLRLRRVDRL